MKVCVCVRERERKRQRERERGGHLDVLAHADEIEAERLLVVVPVGRELEPGILLHVCFV